ncbi:MAG TPA: anaerobic ribonucleoside-triphosphate reductase activating protein [Planctomycetota bacterium]|nr:anaerobic ribonucleoside-triphosphate reductase activating protein [Planctomycetota bacterium]HRR79825.1 anaerobic ribonucleoside-triphosphate reductase activating protein [Planctomycetota bacterium]HRT92901.1 anaerobic ribonucleoside-triphosphate reductase activating protein [Planctomycetota bacterium]
MADTLPPIKGFLPTSLIEWEGHLTCALFLPGCNFRCPFCHASDLVVRPEQIVDIPIEAVVRHLRANRGWVDGLVLSGGEATLHEGLSSLIAVVREHVGGVKLDTNGSHPEVIEELLRDGLVDAVALDVKAPLDDRYSAAAGVPVDCTAILATIELLRARDVEREFRTTVVPGLHTARDIVEIARLLGPTERLVLQQFAPLNCLDPAYAERTPHTRDELRQMAAAAAEFVAECGLRGELAPRGASR